MMDSKGAGLSRALSAPPISSSSHGSLFGGGGLGTLFDLEEVSSAPPPNTSYESALNEKDPIQGGRSAWSAAPSGHRSAPGSRSTTPLSNAIFDPPSDPHYGPLTGGGDSPAEKSPVRSNVFSGKDGAWEKPAVATGASQIWNANGGELRSSGADIVHPAPQAATHAFLSPNFQADSALDSLIMSRMPKMSLNSDDGLRNHNQYFNQNGQSGNQYYNQNGHQQPMQQNLHSSQGHAIPMGSSSQMMGPGSMQPFPGAQLQGGGFNVPPGYMYPQHSQPIQQPGHMTNVGFTQQGPIPVVPEQPYNQANAYNYAKDDGNYHMSQQAAPPFAAVGAYRQDKEAYPGFVQENLGQTMPRKQQGDSRGVNGRGAPGTSKRHHQQDNQGRRDRRGNGRKGNGNGTGSRAVPREKGSKLLEQFRLHAITNLRLNDLVGHVVEFSCDQHGSRFIQSNLERASVEQRRLVFEEVLPKAKSLMMDVFGNYVVQRLIQYGSDDEKEKLVRCIRGNVVALTLHVYGCRVVQTALEHLSQDTRREIIDELQGHVLECVKDQNGNHVIQKCIEQSQTNQNVQFMLDDFAKDVWGLSTHSYGCRVIQRVVERCPLDQIGPILEQVYKFLLKLIEDQYGNYVVQHVIQHGNEGTLGNIIKGLKGHVLEKSQHKYASNVVEKVIVHASAKDRAELITEVLTKIEQPGVNGDKVGVTPVNLMIKDQFANYVVQKMIDLAEEKQRSDLIELIRKEAEVLRSFPYGKHILRFL